MHIRSARIAYWKEKHAERGPFLLTILPTFRYFRWIGLDSRTTLGYRTGTGNVVETDTISTIRSCSLEGVAGQCLLSLSAARPHLACGLFQIDTKIFDNYFCQFPKMSPTRENVLASRFCSSYRVSSTMAVVTKLGRHLLHVSLSEFCYR